jgi:hypothetical protein
MPFDEPPLFVGLDEGANVQREVAELTKDEYLCPIRRSEVEPIPIYKPASTELDVERGHHVVPRDW